MRLSRIPQRVSNALASVAAAFSCPQGQHFRVFCCCWSPSSQRRGGHAQSFNPPHAPLGGVLDGAADDALRVLGCRLAGGRDERGRARRVAAPCRWRSCI